MSFSGKNGGNRFSYLPPPSFGLHGIQDAPCLYQDQQRLTPFGLFFGSTSAKYRACRPTKNGTGAA
jgi:hypothetical protein